MQTGLHFEAFYASWISLWDKYYLQKGGQDLCRRPDSEVSNYVQGQVATIIPHTVVPVQPLLLQESLMVNGKAVERREYAMFEDLRHRHHWVLPTFRYQDTAELLASLQEQIIAPAEQKARELALPR